MGNEQSRLEYVEPGKQVGNWTVRFADGALQSVTYEANDKGFSANVVMHRDDTAAQVVSYPAPAEPAPVTSVLIPVESAAAPADIETAPMPVFNDPAPIDSVIVPVESAVAPADIETAPVPVFNDPAPIESVIVPVESAPVPVDNFPAPVDSVLTPVDVPVSVDYAVNDNNGNEQTRKEHMDSGKQIGEWTVRMADGTIETVSYEANDHGFLANVVFHVDNNVAPVDSAKAPIEYTAAPVEYTAAPVEYTAAPVEYTAAPVEYTAAPVEYTAAPAVSVPAALDYTINDYNGNVQTRKEHVDSSKQVGEWSARMADGAVETVSYEANDHGYLAHVVIRTGDSAAPADSTPAPVD
jgi:hypothetical protein